LKQTDCANCGAPLNRNSSDKYITCDYCKAENANFSTFEELDLSKFSSTQGADIYKNLALAFKLNDFANVRTLSNSILSSDYSSWIAVTYLALSEFWLGFDDFSHVPVVLGHLEKARLLSDNNEFVVDAGAKIGNNLVLLGVKNDHFGTGLRNSVNAFIAAQSLIGIDGHAKEVLDAYVKKAYSFQLEKLSGLMEKGKADYDPPYLAVQLLFDLAKLVDSVEIFETFYLHGKVHSVKNFTKSYASDLAENLRVAEKRLQKAGSAMVGKSISFSIFGKVQIK